MRLVTLHHRDFLGLEIVQHKLGHRAPPHNLRAGCTGKHVPAEFAHHLRIGRKTDVIRNAVPLKIRQHGNRGTAGAGTQHDKHILFIDQFSGGGNTTIRRTAVIDKVEDEFSSVDATLGIDFRLRKGYSNTRTLAHKTCRTGK